MNALEQLHRRHVRSWRLRALTEILLDLLPPGGSILDVGCGDGLLARQILDRRDDVRLSGIDVRAPRTAHIPVARFDGLRIPCGDGSVDTVLIVDVLHHASDPMALLKEARRVSRRYVVIKDHLLNGPLASARLRFMDIVGNVGHSMTSVHSYYPREAWMEMFKEGGLSVDTWRDTLHLYPLPFDWFFGGSLHFVARLTL